MGAGRGNLVPRVKVFFIGWTMNENWDTVSQFLQSFGPLSKSKDEIEKF